MVRKLTDFDSEELNIELVKLKNNFSYIFIPPKKMKIIYYF